MKTIYEYSYIRLIGCLRAAHEKAGLTQAQAARCVGMSRAWVGKIERREIGLDVLHFAVLCRAYRQRPSRLLRSLDEEPP